MTEDGPGDGRDANGADDLGDGRDANDTDDPDDGRDDSGGDPESRSGSGVSDDAGDADDAGGSRDPAPDPDRVEYLREIAEEIRADSSESKQVANVLYRISDVYDPEEDTDVRDVYVNMKQILRVKEQGGMGDGD